MLRLGARGPLVVKLQSLLDQRGYHLALDGDFGPLTYAAVRNFQAAHGLAVDGIAGPATFSALTHLPAVAPQPSTAPPPADGPIREWARGPKIASLQEQLTHAGFSTHGIDGIFGPETLAAVVAFQRAHGLTPNGLVGPLTWQALAAAQTQPSAQVNRGASGTGSAVAGLALKFRGYRYLYGGASPATGFDCSGFTQYVYHQFGINLPRTSYAQWDVGQHVSYDGLQPGDLVFFTINGSFAAHVGIYLGGGEFISAATPSQGVIVQNLSTAFWAHSFDGATRVVP